MQEVWTIGDHVEVECLYEQRRLHINFATPSEPERRGSDLLSTMLGGLVQQRIRVEMRLKDVCIHPRMS